MEEVVFVGYQWGTFVPEGQTVSRPYCSVFVVQDFAAPESDTYHHGGQSCAKYACVSTDVFSCIMPGTKVRLFFDSRKRVSYMQPVDNAD